MTTYKRKETTCRVCGATSRQVIMTSTYANGYADLDSRPAPAARHDELGRVQVCPECGYCALVLDGGPAAVKRVVASQKYAHQLNSTRYPPLANQWLCVASIKEAAGEYSEAAWACLYAAWVCDDVAENEILESPKGCRRKAIARFLKARSAAALTTAEPMPNAEEDLVLVDLLRRVGCFDRASSSCRRALAADPTGAVRQLLELELKLISERDATCHCAGEVLETEEERAQRWQAEHPPLRERLEEAMRFAALLLIVVFVGCVGAILLPVNWVVKKLSRDHTP